MDRSYPLQLSEALLSNLGASFVFVDWHVFVFVGSLAVYLFFLSKKINGKEFILVIPGLSLPQNVLRTPRKNDQNECIPMSLK